MNIRAVKTVKDSLVKPRRLCYRGGETLGQSEAPEANESAPEQPQLPGIPIVDQSMAPTDPEKTFAGDAEFMEQYGGINIDMNKVKGLEGTDYESPVHINIPPDLDKYDKPPRILFYAHGNGEQALKQTKYMMEQVEKMRKGPPPDPVIVIRPQDFNIKKGPDGKPRNWGDLDNPNAFQDMIKVAEQMAGRSVSKDITMAAFSGGGKAIQKAVGNLQKKAAKGDAKAEQMLGRIKKVALFDAYAQDSEEIKKWQQDSPNHILHYNTKETHNSHGNAMLDFKKFANRDGIGDAVTEAPTDENAKMRIPERQEGAMTGTQFTEALSKCKSLEDRQTLILQQAALGAFAPNFRKVKEYKTKVDGKEVTVRMHGPVEFGTGDDKVRVTMDAETSKALADMLGGNLPTATLQRNLKDNSNIPKIPLFNGNDIIKEYNAERAKQGLPALAYAVKVKDPKTGKVKTVPNGEIMKDPLFALVHSRRVEQYKKDHNISDDEITFGSTKAVVIPEQADRLNEGKKLDIYGGLTPDLSKVIQKKPQSPHYADRYADYSQSTEIIGAKVKVGEEEVPFKQIMTDPKYANIRKALFSANAIDVDKAYKYPLWMQKAVDKYRQDNNLAPMQIARPNHSRGNESATTAPQPSGGIPIGGGGGGNYGGGGGARSTSSSPSPQSVETPPSETEPSPEVTTKSKETQITGSAIYLGDSIFNGLKSMKEMNQPNNIFETKDGLHASQLKKMLQPPLLTDALKNNILKMENAIVLIGTNDIGSNRTTEEIFNDIEEIWKILEKINPNIKITAVTIPPFKGYNESGHYGKNYEAINKKRLGINERIKQSSLPSNFIDLCKPINEGGLASPDDPNMLAKNTSGDNLHPKPSVLGDLINKRVSPQTTDDNNTNTAVA